MNRIDKKEISPGLMRERADSLTTMGAKVELQRLRQALRAAQKKGDRNATGWALLNITMVLSSQRDYPAVIKILEEARGIFVASENDLGLAAVYEELSFSNRELNRNALALEYAHKAVGMFQSQGRALELAWAYDNLAVIYFNRFQRHESLSYAKRARALFQEFDSPNGLAWNACNMANLYQEMGFFSRSSRFYTEAKELFTQLGSKQGNAWTYFGMGRMYRGQGNFKEAEECLKKSRKLFSGLGLKERVGWCILNLAAVKRIAGLEEESLSLNRKAIQLFSPLRYHDGLAWGFFQLGQIQRDRGQPVKAWQTFREALNLHTDISNRAGMGWAENEIGKTYLELNDGAHARECFMKANTAAEQLDAAPLRADVNKNIAVLCLDEGHLQKAVESLDRAEAYAHKMHSGEVEADVKLVRARYWTLLGDTARAQAAVDAAKAIVDKFGLERLKPTLGVYLGEMLLSAGKTEEAVRVWQETAALARKMHQRRQRAEALLGLVQAQRRTKTPAQLSLSLFHIEKEIRAVGSRRLKAKFILIKGLLAQQTSGIFDPRFVTQAAQIAGSAGLVVLERLLLQAAAECARRANRPQDAKDIEADLKTALERGTPDLHLIRYAAARAESFPVSVIA